jgi:hypothetical protein
MSCSCSEDACRKSVKFFFLAVALAVAGVFLASLPELKRYIKISSM